jgi:ATP-binding cassette, subfamily B, bacterial
MNSSQENFDFQKALNVPKVKAIWILLKGFRLPYAGATISLAFASIAKTSTILLLRYLVDDILTNNIYVFGTFTKSVIAVGIGFVLFALVEGSLSYVSGRLAAYTAENITRQIRNFMYDHIQRLTFAYHSKVPTGDLISRVTSDIDSFNRFIGEQLIGTGRIVFIFAVNFIAIWQLDRRLAINSTLVIPLTLIVSIWFFKKVTKAFEKYQEQESILSTTLQENLNGVRVVKAFAMQVHEKEKFEIDNHEKFDRGKAFLIMHSMFWPISDIILGFQMLGGLLFGAVLTINGEITIGTYIAFSMLIVWLIWPIRNLGRLIVQTSTGIVSLNRLLEIVKESREDLTKSVNTPTTPPLGKIEFKNVSFAYDDEEPILRNLSFTLEAGKTVAILGTTGSGKTSMVNLLPRFYDYTGGEIFLDDMPLNQYSKDYLRQHIGIVEQEPFLFSRTIGENISQGSKMEPTQEEINEAARNAAIHDVIIEFPDGYKTAVGEKGVTLSGGQKQRIAIARTLLKNPKILIMDDSTSSVDTETEAKIRIALNSLMKDRTTFIIAHRIQSVMIADLILVLDKGKIVQMGNHDQLMEEEGIYKKTYDIQTQIDSDLAIEIGNL